MGTSFSYKRRAYTGYMHIGVPVYYMHRPHLLGLVECTRRGCRGNIYSLNSNPAIMKIKFQLTIAFHERKASCVYDRVRTREPFLSLI